MTLLCYDTGTHTAALNMAIDEVLFKKNEPVLRLYRWAGTAITLGRYQACMEVDVNRAETDGVPVIRRETGGKAVLHGDDLTISLMLLKSKVTESVKKAVMKVGEGIVQGLRLLGIEAQQVVKGNKYHRSSYCFSLHSPYEVVVGIKKIAGIAGRRYMGKELYQVSIPFHVNPGDVRKYIILNNNAFTNNQTFSSVLICNILYKDCSLFLISVITNIEY